MKAAKIKRLLESGAAPPKSGDTFEKFEKPGGTLSRQGPKKFIIWVDVQLAKN